MDIRAVFCAIFAAILGALIWALISYFTGYEIGWVAWGIGGLVGLGGTLMGGEGKNMGFLCGGLALVAIFVGKILAVNFAVQHEIENQADIYLTQQEYNSQIQEARDYMALESDEEYAEFMVRHEYTEVKKASNVSQEEIDFFKELFGPEIEAFHASPPSYEEWRDEKQAMMEEFADQELSPVELVMEDLNFFDAIFALLGVTTAYSIVARQGED